VQGTAWPLATEADLLAGLKKAFDYRGDITITTRDGLKIEGYLFDRRTGPTLEASLVRIIPKDGPRRERIAIAYSGIAAIEFSGRDTAAGKSWEAWVKKYQERKAAGETGIALEPEALD